MVIVGDWVLAKDLLHTFSYQIIVFFLIQVKKFFRKVINRADIFRNNGMLLMLLAVYGVSTWYLGDINPCKFTCRYLYHKIMCVPPAKHTLCWFLYVCFQITLQIVCKSTRCEPPTHHIISNV